MSQTDDPHADAPVQTPESAPPRNGASAAPGGPGRPPGATPADHGEPGRPEGNGARTRAPLREAPAARPRRPIGLMDVVWFLPRLVFRIFFPRLLDRYVMSELMLPLVFGWTLFIVLFVFSVNLFKLAQLAARGAPLDAIGEMVWLRVILASVYCLPMSMLLAGLMAFGRLSGDSEIIAFQAGGIPNLRVVWNALLLGLALSFAGLAINEYAIPPAGRRLQVLDNEIKALLKNQYMADLAEQKAFVIQDFDNKVLSRVVIAKKFETATDRAPATLTDVTYMQYEKGQVAEIVQAQRAEYVGPEEGHAARQRWIFFHSNVQFLAPVTRGQKWVWYSDKLDLYLNKTPEQVKADLKDATQMNYRELERYLRDLRTKRARGRIIRELEVELERKLAVPFAAVVLAMIGAPLGIRRQRSTAGVGIGLSLLIIIVYYIGLSFLGVLGENGQIGPREAAWGCNIVGLLVGLYLTARSSR